VFRFTTPRIIIECDILILLEYKVSHVVSWPTMSTDSRKIVGLV
jgi:hypothetical protein